MTGNMFFYISKFMWFIVAPGNLLFLALIVGVILLWTPWKRTAKYLLSFVAMISLFIAVIPLGTMAISVFEDRFSKPTLSDHEVDGIIVLGGVISPALSVSRNELSFGSATERLIAFAALAKRYPKAKLVFTGGSGDPFNPNLSEAHMIRPLLANLGMPISRIQFEGKSRNTVENAQMTYDMIQPQTKERWLLVTSAFHMPRAVGCFRRVGWNVIAYPVDYGTMGNADMPALQFNFTLGISYLNAAVHEALGLLMYFLSDKTDSLFPAPSSPNANIVKS